MPQIERYFEAINQTKSLSTKTLKSYENSLKKLSDYCRAGGIIIDQSFDMHAFATELSKTMKGTSIQLCLTTVRHFLKWLGCPTDYSFRIAHDERKDSQRKSLARWFSEEDVAKCLAYDFAALQCYVKTLRNKILVRLLVETGARIKELSLIRAEDVNIETRMIMLNDSKTVPRPVFFSPETAVLMEKLLLRVDGGLFPSEDQCAKIVKDMLSYLGLKNGSDERGPHTFRHYVATWLHYEGGMDIKDIAFLLGDQPDTIVNVYIHPTPDMLRRRVGKAMGW